VVGVLQADILFNFPDFRSFERAFQMITQVKGRAGRGFEKGSVFIQTSNPKHKVIEAIIENNLEKFYEEILLERKEFNFPPYSRLIELKIMSKDLNELNHLSDELFKLLKPNFEGKLLGPEFPLVSRIKNMHQKIILIKASKTNISAVRQTLNHYLNILQSNFKNWNYRVSINVDPM
jgi:primosomal protein N' (replication factor Y)